MERMRRKLAHIRPSWRALVALWREEFSFRVQAVFGGAVFVFALALGLSATEFAAVVLAIGAVLAVEALNTAIEQLCDHVTPSEHPRIGKVKDLASAASGLIGTAAIAVGLVIFIPHLMCVI